MIDRTRHGPWAVITGGSEGIGAAFAHQLGDVGINVVLVARREGPLAATAADVRARSGVEVRTASLDVSQPDLVDRVRDLSDDIEVGLFVNNVGGLFANGPYFEADTQDVHRTIRSMVDGPAALAHHFGARMLLRRRGGIILVGSLAGSAGGPRRAMYNASKAFTQILAEGLWAEVESKGIDVAYVVVGSTDTPARARAAGPTAPGQVIDDPRDIAAFALENIANGPVLIPPRLLDGFTTLSSPNRRQAAETMRAMFTGAKTN